MKNLLSYSHAYPGGGHNGGAETTLHDLMRLLRVSGYPTTALLSKPHPDGSGSYLLDGVHVQAHSSRQDPELYFPRSDLIISHLECAARSGLVSRKWKKKAVHLLHNDQEYCVTAAEKYADALIFNTDWIKESYRGCNVPGVVLHPPVDPSRYKVDSSREYITIVNLTVGQTHRLSYDKGANTFYELARRFPMEKFLGVKGGYGEQFVPDDLPANVTIMEHTNNPLAYYRVSKVVLTPSKYESYGRVAVEAGCSGIPSIMTPTEGTFESMANATTYAPFGDFDQWEIALKNVLGAYHHWSVVADERARHNWERTLSELEDVKEMIENL